MARATWSGSISFGLVSVPVKVYTAVREHTVHFHQVEKMTGARIRYEKVSEKTGREVGSEDIELGYELEKGKLVTVDPDQIEELRPRTTRTIDIADFVDLAEIDPVYYARTYWLAPDGEAARRPYSLLVAAMDDRQQVGIGTVVMRNKQYLAAIRPREGALAMSTMHFADEVVPRSDIEGIPSASKAEPKEMRLATQIIDTLSGPWEPSRYHDTYTEEVHQLIERQAEGENVVVEEAPAAKAPVLDLMAALEASLAASKKAGKTPSSRLRQIEKAADRLAREADDEGTDGEADDGDGKARPTDGSGGTRSRGGGSRSGRRPAARRSGSSGKSSLGKSPSGKSPSGKRSSSGKSRSGERKSA